MLLVVITALHYVIFWKIYSMLCITQNMTAVKRAGCRYDVNTYGVKKSIHQPWIFSSFPGTEIVFVLNSFIHLLLLSSDLMYSICLPWISLKSQEIRPSDFRLQWNFFTLYATWRKIGGSVYQKMLYVL